LGFRILREEVVPEIQTLSMIIEFYRRVICLLCAAAIDKLQSPVEEGRVRFLGKSSLRPLERKMEIIEFIRVQFRILAEKPDKRCILRDSVILYPGNCKADFI
jgi:hypothetical protein